MVEEKKAQDVYGIKSKLEEEKTKLIEKVSTRC